MTGDLDWEDLKMTIDQEILKSNRRRESVEAIQKKNEDLIKQILKS
jgi:hypothetical protein